MTISEIQNLKTEIDPKKEQGDFITLSKMLGVAQATARMRYTRKNEEAVITMKKIIDAREGLIESAKDNS